MHPVRIVQVDAFTNEAFRGNPAAVCVLDRPPADLWMQRVAREMNLSETAFLHPEDDAWSLRWFTPTHEVDLCGHATLAAAHVLWEDGRLDPGSTAGFATASGQLSARRDGEWIVLDFPAEPPEPIDEPEGLSDALGAKVVRAHRNRFDTVAEMTDEATVRGLRPRFDGFEEPWGRGVIVTAPASTRGADYVCRVFAPLLGIPEDPVTGSAQCALGPLWQTRMRKGELIAHQISDRGGVLRVSPRGNRVLISGQAVTVMRAELLVGPG